MSSPTQRSLNRLRKAGYLAAVVERFNSFTKRRHDLFKFIDIVAIRGNETLAVQATSASNVSAREAKIRSLNEHRLWLLSANRRIRIHGWAKRGPRGKRKLWTCIEREVA